MKKQIIKTKKSSQIKQLIKKDQIEIKL